MRLQIRRVIAPQRVLRSGADTVCHGHNTRLWTGDLGQTASGEARAYRCQWIAGAYIRVAVRCAVSGAEAKKLHAVWLQRHGVPYPYTTKEQMRDATVAKKQSQLQASKVLEIEAKQTWTRKLHRTRSPPRAMAGDNDEVAHEPCRCDAIAGMWRGMFRGACRRPKSASREPEL